MRSNQMRYVSRERIEREIELQRIKREGINPPPKKIPRKKNRKRVYHKRGPYKPREAKTSIYITKKERKKTETFDKKAILKVIRENGPITRNELVNIIKLPRSTLFDNLNKLTRENILKTTSVPNGKRGRPQIMWSIK